MKKFLIASLFFSFAALTVSAQSTQDWTEKKATKWFKKKEYLNGLAATPVAEGIDKVQFAKQYSANKALWDKAFTYLKETNLQTVAPGRVAIDGDNVYAIISEAPSKDYDKTAFESHQNYIDLQYVISGEENMGKAPLASVKIDKPYNERNDISYYTGEGKIYTVPQNNFLIFFPSDAHRPSITPGGNKVVKKVVVKIRYAK
jgi:biofilm protein TabA